MNRIKLKVIENQVSLPTVIEGISPVVSFQTVEDGAIMTVQDREGEHSVFIQNGSKGEQGDPGEKGDRGEKGDKGDPGDNYVITQEDLQEISSLATETLQNEINQKLNATDAEDIYAHKNEAVIDNAISMGRSTVINQITGEEYAHGDKSVGTGQNVIATNTASHAEGINSMAYGIASHAEGYGTSANASYSHAEGYGIGEPGGTVSSYYNSVRKELVIPGANGVASHVEGQNGLADGQADHAEGINTSVDGKGYSAHAEGYLTWANEKYSHAEGYGTITSAAGAHAEGISSIASGTASHAEGSNTEASGTYSHAEGQGTISSGIASSARGTFNYNRTIDDYSSVPDWAPDTPYDVGYMVKNNSRLYVCNIANNDPSFYSWKWKEIKVSYADVVGNGASNFSRSNAYALDWEGNASFAGDVFVHSDSQSSNGTKLATESYVNTVSAPITNEQIDSLFV